jgi:hypothetical protein
MDQFEPPRFGRQQSCGVLIVKHLQMRPAVSSLRGPAIQAYTSQFVQRALMLDRAASVSLRPRKRAGYNDVRRPVRGLYCFLMLIALWQYGCDRRPRAGAHDAAAMVAEAYPPGRWRLAATPELDNTIMWVSHIVITHGRSLPARDPRLGAAMWPSEQTDRTEQAAYDLASMVAHKAEARPGEFAVLARQYSDDRTTRETGGSLGGVQADRLPPAYLDALASLEPGQVSRVLSPDYSYGQRDGNGSRWQSGGERPRGDVGIGTRHLWRLGASRRPP